MVPRLTLDTINLSVHHSLCTVCAPPSPSCLLIPLLLLVLRNWPSSCSFSTLLHSLPLSLPLSFHSLPLLPATSPSRRINSFHCPPPPPSLPPFLPFSASRRRRSLSPCRALVAFASEGGRVTDGQPFPPALSPPLKAAGSSKPTTAPSRWTWVVALNVTMRSMICHMSCDICRPFAICSHWKRTCEILLECSAAFPFLPSSSSFSAFPPSVTRCFIYSV